ncbi:MAG: hypothetical protein IJS08_08735 [Victivallales bacterium]|nr:hypothetical protein [Victivallales bacterium]
MKLKKSSLSASEWRSIFEETIRASQPDILERWKNILDELNDEQYIKVLCSGLVGPSFETEDGDRFTWFSGELQEPLNYLEKLQKAQVLNEAMHLLCIFDEKHEDSLDLLKSMQTFHATITKKDLHRKPLRPIIESLEEYLKMIDELWHPAEDIERKRSRIRKERAIILVFDKYESEITDLLKSHGIAKDFKKEFEKFFDFYNKRIISLSPEFYENYRPKEKRAPRSEESKRRSREGALNSITRKKRGKRRKQN